MRNGYRMIYLPSHQRADTTGCVYEHIVKAELKLGRQLKKGECVHHINGIRNDNRLENLIVFKTVADHTAFHKGAEIELCEDVYVAKINPKNICPICNGYKDKNAKFCQACYHFSCRKIDRPQKEQLLFLILNYPFTQIGKMFNVSDNAIRKWCKEYNLPFKQKEICAYKNN